MFVLQTKEKKEENQVWTTPVPMTKVIAGDRAASREHLKHHMQDESKILS